MLDRGNKEKSVTREYEAWGCVDKVVEENGDNNNIRGTHDYEYVLTFLAYLLAKLLNLTSKPKVYP